MTAIKNLWPTDMGELKETPPKVILQQQADYFNEGMKGVLVAEVRTYGSSMGGHELIHEFGIKLPSLKNYYIELFQIYHSIPAYPVVIRTDFDGLEEFECNDEETFLRILERIFNSDIIKRVIVSLRAQV